MKKLLLMLAVMLSTVGAWAQSLWTMKSPVTTITSGKYVLVGMCSHGTGPCYYNSAEAGNRLYRLDKSKSEVTTGSLIESSYVWDVELLADGKITVKWADDNSKFFIKDSGKNQNFQGTDMAQLIPEVHTIDGKDYIALTLEDTNIGFIHANAPGGNPNLSYWNSYGDEGTAVKFTFYPVEQATTVAVTYSYKYDGVVKTSEEVEAAIGGSFPTGSVLPDYVTAVWPDGTVEATDAGKTYEIECNSTLPFKVSNDYATAHWYNMTIRSNKEKYVASSSSVPYPNGPTSLNRDGAKWAFMGNPFDGIKVLNKAAGAGQTLGVDGSNNVVMLDGEKTWVIQEGVGGFLLLAEEGTNKYVHDYGSTLMIWDNGSAKTDPGSAFKIYEYVDYGIYGTLLYNGTSMEEGKYYRIQSTAHKTFTGLNGYSLKMQNQDGNLNDPSQIWKYEKDGDVAYLKNVYADLYPQYIVGGGENTTSIGQSKDYAFTFELNNEKVDDVWNIYFGGRQVNIESNGNVNQWFEDYAHHYIYEVEATDDELATMCVNWYNANPLEDSDKPSVSASDYKKIDIDPNATEIISPSEFAAPSVINGMIDHLAELEQNISIVEVNQANIHKMFAALAEYSSAVNSLNDYKDAVTAYGELLSITYTPKAEWGTIILPINWANPEGWGRYTCAETEGSLLTLADFAGGGKNIPMIISVPAEKIGTTYQMIGYSNGAGTENVTEGLLTGVLEDNTFVPEGSYVLSKYNGKIGFYPVSAGTNYEASKYKCYLTLPAASARYNALYFDETETGIIETEGENAKAEIYDMSGRRVQKVQKGLYIVNGVKVIK